MTTTTQVGSIPEWVDGDRITADEFEKRNHASDLIRKAELIDGVVYVASPVSGQHGTPHALVTQWFGFYQWVTPYFYCSVEGTIRLDDANQPQPDVILLIEPDHGGQATISDDHYVEGAPELIVEISVGTQSIDLTEKLEIYRQSGAREYIVWRVLEKSIDWFRLREGRYERLPMGEDGLYRSEVFPGLWLDPEAMIQGDRAGVYRVVQLGIASADHALLVERLQNAARD